MKKDIMVILFTVHKGRVAWEQRDNRRLFSPTAQNSIVLDSTGQDLGVGIGLLGLGKHWTTFSTVN